jgi:tRNA A37 methylthiotransferase MiaB
MNLAIVDANYAQDKYEGMAAAWLRWELHRAGVSESPPELADVLLSTVSSQQGVSELRGAIKRAANKRARVVVGGGGAYAPAVFDGVASVTVVGEGARFVRTLLRDGYEAATALPECWIPGETRPVVPSTEFPWDVPPLKHPDGTVRVFGSRGCRYRCLFCQTGWETTYRVNPNPERLQQQVRALEQQGARLAIVTNDGAEIGVKLSGQSEFLSVRLENDYPKND